MSTWDMQALQAVLLDIMVHVGAQLPDWLRYDVQYALKLLSKYIGD